MKRMIVALLWSITAFSLTIKEKLEQGVAGSFVVFEQNGTQSVLLLKEKNETTLLLEEITVPKRSAPKKGHYPKWVAAGCNGASSWTVFRLDLATSAVTDAYSYTAKKWLPSEQTNALFGTLSRLLLSPLPESKQRKVGPEPVGEVDRRKKWKPQLIKNGKAVKERDFAPYMSTWPKDGTDLSGKPIEVYFDAKTSDFPFPYWIQVNDSAIQYKLRAIDSGVGMNSPHTPPVKKL